MGKVTRAHGVKGEVAVAALSTVESRFQPGSRLFVGDSEEHPVTISTIRPHRQRLLVVFEEVGDREAAERLRGQYLFVPAEWAPSLPEGEFWAHQLIGCGVATVEGRRLGRIHEVIHTPANDVWVAVNGGHEVLIPALRDVVESVDVEGRRVVVREIPGLTAP